MCVCRGKMLLDETDCPCTKTELEFFEQRPVQTVLDQSQWVDIHPLNSVTQGSAPIEFTINSTTDDYLDLNDTMLFLRCKVVKANGDNFAAADNQTTALINNGLHSLFSDIKLSLGNTQIEGGDHMYGYKAYLSNLLLFSNAVKASQLVSAGFVKDTAGQFSTATDDNKGHKARLAMVKNSRSLDLCGPLWIDFMTQGKYLLNQVDVHLKLIRAKPEFCLMGAQARVDIESAVLYVRRVKVSPGVIMKHAEQLSQMNALYPVQHSRLITYTIPSGTQSHTRDGLFRGHMPKMLIFGMVTNKAYSGNIETNPFEFQHFGVNHIALYREGATVPFRPFTPNFANGQCVREYMSCLVHSLELYNSNESNGISLKEFASKGYNIFAFNLTPDLSVTGHAQPYREGNLRLDLKFAQALDDTINVVVFAIFDGKVEISQNRQVIVDYKG